ncbi:MAG: hypothetical protein DWI02_08740 [Planctomycetota bacterium]|nr:MAG: hypothetical protein DWI02_08740 [Planctomycetota bacterium]
MADGKTSAFCTAGKSRQYELSRDSAFFQEISVNRGIPEGNCVRTRRALKLTGLNCAGNSGQWVRLKGKRATSLSAMRKSSCVLAEKSFVGASISQEAQSHSLKKYFSSRSEGWSARTFPTIRLDFEFFRNSVVT